MFIPNCSRGQDAAGEEVIKPYTPTTLDSDLGSFELVIKVSFNKMVFFFSFPNHSILSSVVFYASLPLWSPMQLFVHCCVSPLIFFLEDVSPRKNVPSFP